MLQRCKKVRLYIHINVYVQCKVIRYVAQVYSAVNELANILQNILKLAPTQFTIILFLMVVTLFTRSCILKMLINYRGQPDFYEWNWSKYKQWTLLKNEAKFIYLKYCTCYICYQLGYRCNSVSLLQLIIYIFYNY